MIALAIVLLGRAQHGELIPLVIALIVGIHFIPLASIFHVPAYSWTGITMSLLAAIALAFIFWDRTLGGPFVWDVIIGLGSALILWLTALYMLSTRRQ